MQLFSIPENVPVVKSARSSHSATTFLYSHKIKPLNNIYTPMPTAVADWRCGRSAQASLPVTLEQAAGVRAATLGRDVAPV